MASLIPTSSPPAKRQRINGGYSTNNSANSIQAYNSDADSGDDLFENFIPDTPATAGRYETQPTQILDRPNLPHAHPSSPPSTIYNEVQVPGSSPLIAKSTVPARSVTNGLGQNGAAPQKRTLAMSMAPAGTTFRAPIGITPKPIVPAKPDTHTYISIDDSSSEDDGRADIKPSTFRPKSANNSFDSSPPNIVSGNSKFQSVVSNAAYKGPGTGAATSEYSSQGPGFGGYSSPYHGVASLPNPRAGSMPMGYGNAQQRPPMAHMRPERAQPIQDIGMGELGDHDMRERVTRLRQIFPSTSILVCRNALLQSRGSVDEAAVLLSAQDADEVASPRGFAKPMFPQSQLLKKPDPPQMKRTVEAPLASLKDRYSSTQAPAPRPLAMATPPPKPKKKLVQGRRHPSSPVATAFSSPLKHQSSPVISLDDFDSDDSGVASEVEDDPELEDRILTFLNKCTVNELVELTSTTRPYAELMIEARPFKTCDAARCVENQTKTKGGKKSARAPIGDKIVETAIKMFTGYEAIDALVSKCKELGKPLYETMASWGFDVFGAAKGGELEMTSFEEDKPSPKDSGIGSPASAAVSVKDDGDEDIKIIPSIRKKSVDFLKQPAMMPAEDVKMKDYQVVGLNWLAMMYRQKLSGILADEMGLGKTCQVIALLSYLVETGHPGPHLVICPGSTLENWLREFRQFSPSLTVEVYYGSQKDRAEMAQSILERRAEINVVVSTYDLAAKAEDNKFMRRLRPDVCVYDEGHYLKNVKSQRYAQLVKIPAKFKLLLTGTPLQNNLQELVSLLAFILPDVFAERQEDLEYIFRTKTTTRDTDHAALLSAQRIDRARSMLTPFVLRRKKQQVLKHLPSKTCRVEYCTLQSAQQKIYDGHLDQARERARVRIEGGKIPKSETDENNPLMQLRKAAIHPLLFRRHFTNEKIEKMADVLRKKEPIHFPSDKNRQRHHLVAEMRAGSDFWLHQWCRDFPCISSYDIPDLAWMDSGKIESMIKLVQGYKKNGDRVLIFSQFSLVLDILEAVLNSSLIHFTRIDGSTEINKRQTLIDTFRDDESITVFLLTTKAGGTGINLMFANKVIIFDGSFNPQDDKQAENRAHRVGQTRDVEVVRLVTRDTIEEQIYALGVSKLTLDGRVSGDDAAADEAGQKNVAKMFLEGLKAVDDGPVTEGVKSEERDAKDCIKRETKECVKEGEQVDENVKKPEALPKRKKSSILDLVTMTNSAAKKESDVVECDEEGKEILV